MLADTQNTHWGREHMHKDATHIHTHTNIVDGTDSTRKQTHMLSRGKRAHSLTCTLKLVGGTLTAYSNAPDINVLSQYVCVCTCACVCVCER